MRHLTHTHRIAMAILLCIGMQAAAFTPQVPKSAPFIPDTSVEQAYEYLDSSPIHEPEGIYHWTETGTLVLVRRCTQSTALTHSYEIVALLSADALLAPGQVVGYLYRSASPTEYHAYMYESITEREVSKPHHMAGIFDGTTGSLQFRQDKSRLRLHPLALIPRLRSVLRVEHETPTEDIPCGLLRVYPPTDSGHSSALPHYF